MQKIASFLGSLLKRAKGKKDLDGSPESWLWTLATNGVQPIFLSSHILRPPLPAWQSPSQAVRTDKTGGWQLSLGEKGSITVGSGCGKGQCEMIFSSLHQALGRDLGKLILVRILTLHWLLPVIPRLRQQAPVSTRI